MAQVNGLRLLADGLQLVALALILFRLFAKHDAQGISLKTHELILIISIVRHLSLDFFRYYYGVHSTFVTSIYAVSIKVVSVAASIAICYTMRRISPVKNTYRPDLDTVRHWINLFFPVACFSLFACFSFLDPMSYFWSLSLLLGAVCLIPQISMLRYHSQVDTRHGEKFAFLMGASYICFLFSCLDSNTVDFDYVLQSNFDSLMLICIPVFLFSTIWMAFWELTRTIPTDSNEVNGTGASNIFVFCREMPWNTILVTSVLLPSIYVASSVVSISVVWAVRSMSNRDNLYRDSNSCDFSCLALMPWIAIFLVLVYFHRFYYRLYLSRQRRLVNEGNSADLAHASDNIVPSIAERVANEQRQLALEACVEDHESVVFVKSMNISSTFALLIGWIFVILFASWGTPLALCCCVTLTAGYVFLKSRTPWSSQTAQDGRDDLDLQETITHVHTVSVDQELGAVVTQTFGKPTITTNDSLRDPLLTIEDRRTSL